MLQPKFVDLEQGTQEWLDFRKMKIGCSSAPSIMGVGFKTPLQLFEEMIEDRSTPVNNAMRRGNELEPVARKFLCNKYRCEIEPAVIMHPDDRYDWHYSSLDGIAKWEDTYFVTEIKCPGKTDHEMAMDGVVPPKYIPQCYHILEDLPGVDQVLYFSYNENSQAAIWVGRDEEKMKLQFEEEKKFYQNLLAFVPPEPQEADWMEFFGPEKENLANKYLLLKKAVADATEEMEKLKKDLLLSTENVSRAKIGDLKIQKVVRKGSVDYSKIEALKALDLDLYRKDPIVTWRFS